jgi:hypothetical protein
MIESDSITHFELEDIMAHEMNNMLRSLTMLKKALDRLGRLNYFHRKQYPAIFLEIEESIDAIQLWIRKNMAFSSIKTFYTSLSDFMETLAGMICQLWDTCKPKSGKREMKKSHKIREQEAILKSIDTMISKTRESVEACMNTNTEMASELEKSLEIAFSKTIIKGFADRIANLVSQRGEKTYIFACENSEEYSFLIKDKIRFRTEVVDKLCNNGHLTGHKHCCKNHNEYILCGFRKNPRKTRMKSGEQETFEIRIVKCVDCGQKFSLLPSFLPREKNFDIDIIGNVYQNLCLFGLSVQGCLRNLAILGEAGVRSKQTIFNWIRWMGTHHPATLLTRAGIKGSGYLQEDEGFEKEPNLRTYSVVMVDPKTMLVWHADYVDHVDEKTLAGSFQAFLERINFSILGVTKDKWRPSTSALKTVFHKIWIGYCHRHCLKRFHEVLEEYQKLVNCSRARISELYLKFKKILKTSTSKANMEAKIRCLDDEAFGDPLLQARLTELRENASHYTAYKNRKGITETTSLVDNYLKIVKRKLRQVESFRDKEWTALFFRAQANTRNFVTFNPGAKNVGKSPFMLAAGQTHNLPWIQVMNMHNAFLFTEKAL